MLLIDRLQRLVRREYRRLFVFMPPGSAKSTYSSVLFPAWYLASANAGPVLAASHTVTLAARFGRKVRNLVSEHSVTLGYGLSADSTAADRWETNRGIEYYAAGVGTGIAGFRADLGIIDDPVASREMADSEASRETTWQWYNDDFSNRLKPGALELIIMTRWHEDDLAGRLLSRSDPIPTEVLTLPAIAGAEDPLGRSPGQWLWEGEYGYAERLKEKHATSDPRSWSALYQQNPIPEEGIFLDVGRIKRMDAPKKEKMRIFAASDYATSDGGGDYTVHVVGGLDSDDVLHVLDVWRRQTTTDVWVEQMIGMGKSWQPLEWGEPNDIIYKSVSPTIERRMSQERAWINRKPYPQIRDKPTRARPLQARVSQGKLAIAHGAHWAEDLISEMARFPASKHDDQVDAVALLAVVADTFGPPEKDSVSEEPDTEDYGRSGSFWGNL